MTDMMADIPTLPMIDDTIRRAQAYLDETSDGLIVDETSLIPNLFQGLWIVSYLNPTTPDLDGGGLAVDKDRVWDVSSNPSAEEYIGIEFPEDEEEEIVASAVPAVVDSRHDGMMAMVAEFGKIFQASQQPQQPIQIDLHLPERLVQVDVQPVPTPDIYVTVEPSVVQIQPTPAPEVTVHVEPSEVQVQSIPAPEVTVSVEPTPVSVNPQIDVHVPEIEIPDITVNLPEPRTVRRDVIRDSQDKIVAVEETEIPDGRPQD